MGSNPIPCATFKLIASEEYIEFLEKVRGNAPITSKNKKIIITALSKRVSNLWDVEEVERYIDESELSNGRKNLYGQAYRDWCNWKGFDFKPKQFRIVEKLPYIPSENEIDQLIAGLSKKLGCFLQIMKESAFRPSETQSLTPDDFNLTTKICTMNKPAKNSRPRQFKMSDKLFSMILPLIYRTKKGKRIYPSKMKTMNSNFYRQKKSIAKKLGNPNFTKITFKTLRHWKATMTARALAYSVEATFNECAIAGYVRFNVF